MLGETLLQIWKLTLLVSNNTFILLKTITMTIWDVELADLHADGDYKLVVADLDKKLKVFKGTSIVSRKKRKRRKW